MDKSYKIGASAICITYQQHERINGSGYPRGIKNGDINEYAKIVGLVDIYEAMTHPRPYRLKSPSCQVIKEIMENNGDLFEWHTIKMLAKCLNLYPVGSWVQLNTGEIGRVANIDKDFPLRPIITIMFDANYNLLKKMKRIELMKRNQLYIEQAVNENELRGKIINGADGI